MYSGSYVSYLKLLKYDPTLSFENILTTSLHLKSLLYHSSNFLFYFLFFYFFFFFVESHEYRSDRLNEYALNSLDIMRQTACLVINPIIVDGYASLFNFTTAVRASDSMTASSGGWGLTICLWLGPPWFNWVSFTLAHSRISHEHSFLFIKVINLICIFSL